MKNIQILGTGCTKCKTLAERAERAANDLGIQFTLEKVTDITAIMAAGVMMTPALMVDGEVKVSGRVPTVPELQTMLSQAAGVK